MSFVDLANQAIQTLKLEKEELQASLKQAQERVKESEDRFVLFGKKVRWVYNEKVKLQAENKTIREQLIQELKNWLPRGLQRIDIEVLLEKLEELEK